MFCANCGERNEDGVKFCQKCGAQVNSVAVQNAAVTPSASVQVFNDKPQNIKVLRVMSIIGIVWFSITLLLFIYFLFIVSDAEGCRFIGSLIALYAIPYAVVALGQAQKHKLDLKVWAVFFIISIIILMYKAYHRNFEDLDANITIALIGTLSAYALWFSIKSLKMSKKKDGQQPETQAENKNSETKPKLLREYGIMVFAIVSVIFLLYLINEFALPISSSTAQNNVLELNIGTLTSEISNNPARATQNYQNKTIRLTGFVIQIGKNLEGKDWIWLDQYKDNYLASENGIFVYINSSELRKLANLNKGQRITVRGVYDGGITPVITRAIIE